MAARQPGRPGGGTGPDVRQRALAALGERLRAGPVTGQDWASWLEQVSQGIASPRSALPAGTPAGEALEWLARRYGFAIERKPCPDSGRTIWTQRLIWVSPESDDHAAVRAILHQLGHVAAARLTQVLADCGPACRGVRKAEADSFAYLISARMGLDVASFSFAAPELWAGRDPRAHPEATVLAVAGRIIAAAAPAMQQLPGGARERRPERGQPAAVTARPAGAKLAPGLVRGEPAQAGLFRVLADAHRFYRASAAGSWVPAYFTERGIGPDIGQQWQAGYAPASWTATIGFLRDRGHDPGLIEAAGLARQSSRGTLIDHFRERVMFPVRDRDGRIAGFIGRARPGARPGTPKYLNSPQTEVYRKGELLAGLFEGRSQLSRGAVPVVVEGLFDAMAVTAAGQGRYVGVAPCGTALTREQAEGLAGAADLGQSGVVVALDGDQAGRRAAVRAYAILREFVSMPDAAILPGGTDPASILQLQGGPALLEALQRIEPLAQTVIDGHLSEWEGRLDHPEGQLHAMRSAARAIAGGLPPEAAELIVRISAGLHQSVLDEALRPVENPYLPAIARILPPATGCQVIRAAERTSRDCAEVVAEIVNAVVDSSRMAPGGAVPRRGHGPADAAGLTAASFPRPASAASPARISGAGAPRRSAPGPGVSPPTHGGRSSS